MARHKNADWKLSDKIVSWDECHLAVFMDIRDELQQLNQTFNCTNFLQVPAVLREMRGHLNTIRLNTRKRRKKR